MSKSKGCPAWRRSPAGSYRSSPTAGAARPASSRSSPGTCSAPVTRHRSPNGSTAGSTIRRPSMPRRTPTPATRSSTRSTGASRRSNGSTRGQASAPEAPAGYAGRVYRLLSNAFYYVIAIPLLFLWTRVILGVRTEGENRLPRVGGALTVCNHVHPLDSALVATRHVPAQTRLHVGTGKPPEPLVRRSGEIAGRRRGAAYPGGAAALLLRDGAASWPREGSCTSSPRAS